jgi:hypothetical protein
MRVGQIRTNIEDLGDEVEIFIAWYDKNEANEVVQNNIMEGEEWNEANNLTEDEWKLVVQKMANDDGIWQELNETFYYYVNQVVQNRAKGNEDDNSK